MVLFRRSLVYSVLLAVILFSVFAAFKYWPSPATNTAFSHLSSNTIIHLGANAPPLYLGLDAYRYLDKLSYLEIGDRVTGQSTADPAGSNIDNVNYLRALPNGGRVLFDQTGPGIVTFMRMQESYGGPWSLAVDGRAVGTIGSSDLGQENMTGAFPYPLSLNPQQSQGSSIVATAIPYQQNMSWTSSGPNGNFYALYRKLPYGTKLSTQDSNTQNNDVVSLLRHAGSNIAPAGSLRKDGTATLTSDVPTQITTLTGPSQMRALTFHVPFSEMVGFGNARLHIYWDGEAAPSVDLPVKFLAGDGAGVYQPTGRSLVNGLLASANGDGKTFMDFNFYWPMPFTTSARITITAAAPLRDIGWHVGYEPFPDPPQWWGKFHATYTGQVVPSPGQDMTFLDVAGSGRLVGTVINFGAPDGTLEGDPHIYIDDSQTPQIAVTGTEEWGTGGNYWNGGQQTSLPFGGLPSSINNPPGTDHDGAALYRFLVADSIPFNRHLVVRWEHGGVDDSTRTYRAAMLWYGTPTPTALLSDTLSPGDANSRSSHAYQSQDERLYALTAGNEYTVNSPLSTMTVNATKGTASFSMSLDPRNSGAFLRRTFDYCAANQRANIYVDGHFDGTWYSAGGTNRLDHNGFQRCWREEDYPLTPALTMGKATIQVKIEFVRTDNPQNSAWTASRYLAYSFVLPSSRNLPDVH